MDLPERLALASQHPSPDSVRPDTEEFLARVFPELGFPSPLASVPRADRGAVGPGQAESEVRVVQESREELLDELREISRNIGGKDGNRLRRIAEIVELLDDEEAAYVWWRHAAEAGDPVAVAVVEELHPEQHHPGERPSVVPLLDSIVPKRGAGTIEV
ncbi:hypothetical protein [Streptomyces sp. NPDC005322]|uniref:hypothetical protein n=1 Tax=unclassified Streptomyces TaxID=2593676 RepID=UPI0033B6C4B0